MAIPEPTLIVYSQPPKAIAISDLRQARIDEFLASRSLQPKSRKAYQADLQIFMDWCELSWADISRRKVTQFKTFLIKERELALSSVNRMLQTLKSFYRWLLLSEYVKADPTIGIQLERLPESVAKDLDEDEVVRIYEAIATYFNLLKNFGPAWQKNFVNTYIQVPENGIAIYMPSYAWAQNAPSRKDFRVTDDKSFQVTTQVNNPRRETAWTGIYYDRVAQKWMVSCATPIDLNGRHIGTIVHDNLIDELRERTISTANQGPYNLIFQADGDLIAHPDLMKDINKNKGDFNILKSGNQHLINIFKAVTQENNSDEIINNIKNDEYLVVSKINGPNWYLVSVIPKLFLQKKAFAIAQLIVLLGILSLLIEILILMFIMRRQISSPLGHLMDATEAIAKGNFNTKLDINRKDELGRLAYLFNRMSDQLQDSFNVSAQ